MVYAFSTDLFILSQAAVRQDIRQLRYKNQLTAGQITDEEVREESRSYSHGFTKYETLF